ncbi:MAG: hypothetical protein WC685_01550 [Methylobacter sp.]|jgi:hypothetical protein
MGIFKGFIHVGAVFLLTVAIFATAAGLILLEGYAESNGMPSWLLAGMTFIGMVLFIIDGILVIGSSTIVTLKILGQLWSAEE